MCEAVISTENRLIGGILENIYVLTAKKLYKNKNFKIFFKIDRLIKRNKKILNTLKFRAPIHKIAECGFFCRWVYVRKHLTHQIASDIVNKLLHNEI